MKNNPLLEIVNGFTYVLAAIQSNEVLQLVEFGFSVLTSLFLIVFRLWHWWKEAKQDGKITKEEIGEAIEIVEEEKENGKLH